MIRLQYKTRNDASPIGKPKVYFCSHPDDRENYLPEIAKDILALQDCAVYYADSQGEPDADFWCDLEQMRLFVIPVTARFLGGDHRGLAEFSFAVEKNIPVLPLMQEDGLAEDFNRICGDLQFLCKHDSDATAIGFDEKLKKYLNSVLIGDGLAEQIRKAFDAYIFLSYRKKDRRHAQTLMRLIHQNEFCRDIAIWYDEFLVPGENFNDAILAALKKSKLFALAVTPNLVNEINYVMTTEYPRAIKEKKPVLPVSLVETDEQLLARHYPDLPALTDAYDSKHLADALASHLQALSLAPAEKDAYHDYYIGLAYLGGIDVEASGAKAEELLTSAAEAGLSEAMAQLAAMYRTGNGVKRDGARAVEWQRRLADTQKTCYETERSAETLSAYADALYDLGELLQEELRTEEAEEVYLQTVELYREDEPADPRLLRRLADTHLALGTLGVNRKKEHYDKEERHESGGYTITVSHMHRDAHQWEKTHYTAAVELYERLTDTAEAKEIIPALCDCYIRLGKIYGKGNAFNRSTANAYYSQAVRLCRESGGTLNESLADAYNGLGVLWDHIARSRTLELAARKNSVTYYLSAVKILEGLYKETPALSVLRKLIEAYGLVGEWCRNENLAKDSTLGDKWFDAANSYRYQAEVTAKTLMEKTDSPADRILYGKCLLERGKLWLESPQKDYGKAEPLLLKALELLEVQFNETDMFDVRICFERCNRALGELYEALGDADKAARYNLRAQELSNCATRWETSDVAPIVLDPFMSHFGEYLSPSGENKDEHD